MIVRPTRLIRSIARACSPDLIQPRIQKNRPGDAHHTWGCCYIASEALYHLWGKKHGFRLYYIRFDNQYGHFFLKDADGVVMDPTRRQFQGSGLPLRYSQGTCMGFLTKKPSNRCKRLLARI
jgi:hypothetical protein